MEETAEQVLARLARYADSLKSRPGYATTLGRGSAPAPHDHPQVVVYSSPGGLDNVLPVSGSAHTRARPLSHTTASQAIGFVACVIAILVFALLARPVALVVVGGLGVAGIVSAFRRVPMATSWTVGIAIGAALSLLS